jgi:3-carboxy-cis,cis-muconate cycloisomerase
MEENLEITQGLIYAEAVTTALATRTGKQEARRLVEAACQRATASHSHLRDVLLDTKEVLQHLPTAQIRELFSAQKYSSDGSSMIDKVLAADRSFLQKPKSESA